jgi:predicted ATPase
VRELPSGTAPLVARLDANVIATSRERINVYGEQEYGVPNLRIADAVVLFTGRARLLDPSFGSGPCSERISR